MPFEIHWKLLITYYISLISTDKKKLELDRMKKNKVQFKLTMMFHSCYIDRTNGYQIGVVNDGDKWVR